MNMEDVQAAIMFLMCDDEARTINLVCNRASDMPYVKRALLHSDLPVPDTMIDNMLRWGNKHIRLYHRGSEDNLYGLDPHNTFYVAYEGNTDWMTWQVREQGYIESKPNPYMETPWFNVGDIYTALVRDGKSGQHALDLLSNVTTYRL